MAKLMLSLVAVALVALAAAPVAAQDEKETQTVALEKILGNPQAFEGLTVSFVVQFHRLGRLDAPVFTKFEKDWWQNFSAWPDGAQLWDKNAYQADHQFFFISRLSEGANVVIHTPRYQRLLITAVVDEIFNGRPWFEVKGIKALDTSMNKGALKNLVAAYRAKDQGDWGKAADAFRAADGKTLPANIRLMAMNEEAAARHAVGDTAGAIARLESALTVVENDKTTMSALTTYRAVLGLDADGNPIVPPTGTEVVAVPDGEGEVQPGTGKKVEKVTLDLVPEPKKKSTTTGTVSNDNDN